MYRIRRFAVVKTATIVALIYILLVGIFIIPITIIAAIARPADAATGAAGLLVVGVLAAVLYGLIGWVVTAIACVLYNIAAGWVGGIEVQVEAVAPPPPPPTWGPAAAPPPPPAAPTGG